MGGFLSGAIDESPKVERVVDCGDGFKVTINWLPVATRDKLSDDGTKVKRSKLVSDREGYARTWCKAVVRDWTGLTPDVFLNKLKLYVKPSKKAAVDQVFKDNGGEYPYSFEDAQIIFLNALPDYFATPIRNAIAEMDENDRDDVESEDSKSAPAVRVSQAGAA